jgi:hypothetical protein
MIYEIFLQQIYIAAYLVPEYNEKDYVAMIDPNFREQEKFHQILVQLEHSILFFK